MTVANRSPSTAWRAAAVLWPLYFLICGSLGYDTLNRYDPRNTHSLSDARDYALLVVKNPGENVESHRSLRVLVPFSARPVYALALGRVGTWNAALLALLVVNAALVATASFFLTIMAVQIGVEPATGILAGLLLLVNHTVINSHLSGLVDSAELCAAVLLAIALRKGQWWALIPIGTGAALAKETFVVFGAVMGVVWWWVTWRRSSSALRGAVGIAAMIGLGVAAVLLMRVIFTGAVVSPMALARGFARPGQPPVPVRVAVLLLDPDFWYGLVWLVPLGVWSLRRLPYDWVISTFAAGGVALALGIYAMAGGGNVSRPIISLVGPPLSLAAAITLMRLPWCFRGAGGGSKR